MPAVLPGLVRNEDDYNGEDSSVLGRDGDDKKAPGETPLEEIAVQPDIDTGDTDTVATTKAFDMPVIQPAMGTNDVIKSKSVEAEIIDNSAKMLNNDIAEHTPDVVDNTYDSEMIGDYPKEPKPNEVDTNADSNEMIDNDFIEPTSKEANTIANSDGMLESDVIEQNSDAVDFTEDNFDMSDSDGKK